jgi:hypothetical protein
MSDRGIILTDRPMDAEGIGLAMDKGSLPS